MKKMGKVARLASLLVLTLLFKLFPDPIGNNPNKRVKTSIIVSINSFIRIVSNWIRK